MGKILVIVESPTKAKKLTEYLKGLPDQYVVQSSVGHIRDLPSSSAEIPAKVKKEPWARVGINVEEDFAPLYVVRGDSRKRINELKALLKEVDLLLLATDEDREGEAISWHLLEVLKPQVPVKRMVFHEITKTKIREALAETRELDDSLVEAQETRRIVDRLYGYEVSPILWRKVKPKLSAGRVQSVATRMVVERERERMRFVSAEYWDLTGTFSADEGSFSAKLNSFEGKPIASGKDFEAETGRLTAKADGKVALLSAQDARSLEEQLGHSTFSVISAEEKPTSRRPPAPFITSTLQQEAGRKLNFEARRTMRAAQRLYENGFITYMRTDSVVLSDLALQQARQQIEETFGPEFLHPGGPRFYKGKVQNAQEAHEAIRPAGDPTPPHPDLVHSKLGGDEGRLYELIWKRTLACQMADAKGRRMTLRVGGEVEGGKEAVFQATGTVWDQPGFLRAYVEGSDDPEAALSDKETVLPPVEVGQPLGLDALSAEEHHTTPPARLTEASLVKALEEKGIGRPSTYASIIDTIQRREYVFKKGSALVPTFTAFAVVSLMEQNFGELIDEGFTRQMEESLDEISRGERERLPYLKSFYFGGERAGLKALLEKVGDEVDPRLVNTIPLGVDAAGEAVVARVGRYGPYVQSGERRASVPDLTCPDELTVARAIQLLEDSAKGDEPLGVDPATDKPVYLKSGRFGPYVQLGDPEEGSKKKPKMVSLLRGMTMEQVDLQLALRLLELPRSLGNNPDGEEVLARVGRYGPYLTCGTESRSLKDPDNVLDITLERALQVLAEPKAGRGRQQATALHSYGEVEALDGVELKVMNGRYGPYITDGEVNASLPKTVDDPTAYPLEDALELLAAARERKGKKKAKKKATKKKATKKKAAKKKATKKKATKKAATTKKKATKKAASSKSEADDAAGKVEADGDDA